MNRHSKESIRESLIAEFNAVLAETEQLLSYVADAGGEQADALRGRVERNLAAAKDRLRGLQQDTTTKILGAAQATDALVHQHPWQSICLALGLGVTLGAVLGLAPNRR